MRREFSARRSRCGDFDVRRGARFRFIETVAAEISNARGLQAAAKKRVGTAPRRESHRQVPARSHAAGTPRLTSHLRPTEEHSPSGRPPQPSLDSGSPLNRPARDRRHGLFQHLALADSCSDARLRWRCPRRNLGDRQSIAKAANAEALVIGRGAPVDPTQRNAAATQAGTRRRPLGRRVPPTFATRKTARGSESQT